MFPPEKRRKPSDHLSPTSSWRRWKERHHGNGWGGEDLADENPGTWTPGGSEEEDEDGDEGDLRVDGTIF